MCVAATDINEKTESCEDNHWFLEQASECLERVQKMRNQVTADMKAVMGKNQLGGQNQDFETSKKNHEEAVAAHEFSIKITQTALDELDKYFDYVVQPDDAETDEEVLNTPCYNEAVVPMDDIAEKLENMLEEMKSSKGMEDLMGKVSGTRETNVNALNRKAADTKGQAGPAGIVKKGTSPVPASTITGVEDRKKKEQQQPRK
jgi:hypothetical protein